MIFKRSSNLRSGRIFQAMEGFKKSRQAISVFILLAWIITTPVAQLNAGDILRGVLVQETLAEPQNLGPMLVQSPQMLQKFEPKTD